MFPDLPKGTARCGIVLHPAGHTRSPAMHGAAYRALGIAADYAVFDVEPEGLARFMASAREHRVAQLAVSIPHKETIGAFVDAIDGTAERIGAINTVTRRGDRLEACNTDWLGAVRALEEQGEMELEGARCVVLGGGGTARAVAFGLLERGARVTVLNRTVAKAEAIVRALGAGASGSLADLPDLAPELLVNTTSVGLGSDETPVPGSAVPPGALVMDAVYQPERTRLLREAEAHGARTLSGKWMLIYQGAEQLTLFAKRPAPIDVMAQAFDEAGSRAG